MYRLARTLVFVESYRPLATACKIRRDRLQEGRDEGKIPSTFVPNLLKKILNPMSYCRLTGLRLHSLQF